MDRKTTLLILAAFALFVSACGGSTAAPTASPTDNRSSYSFTNRHAGSYPTTPYVNGG